MNRRGFVHLGLAAALPAQQAPKRSRPNILFLMADQLRADWLGCYGNSAVYTPNLDRIARQGVRFTAAYSSTPSCTPARSALLTGLSPWNHGMLGYTNMARAYPFEKPRAMAEAGYYTTVVGKNHFNPIRNAHGYHQMLLDEHCSYWLDKAEHDPRAAASPEERCDYEAWFWSQMPAGNPHATGLSWNDWRGREFALPERLHPTAWTGDTAVNFLNGYERQEPFFLKVSFIRPHSPYDPPARLMRRYADAGLPGAQAGQWAERFRARSDSSNEIWHGEMPAADVRRSRQAYSGSVSHVDEQIGRILETLDRRRMLDETLILFLSDHGDMLGDQHLWRKSYAYEQSSRIPMLLRFPAGVLPEARGTVRPEPVELRDILPTFLDAAGAPASRRLDGRSLLDLVRNEGRGWREWIDLEHNVCYSPSNHWNALTDGKRKYIFHARDGEEQYFDLESDPRELTDLAGDARHAAPLREWRGRMVAHLAERGDEFVKNGRLALRSKGRMTSPNFPGNT
ncbi:MAG: arylsulfatase [Acidobacteriota bacterium]|nr:arylsulfatase [Acidobacteriota bacterium]